MQKLRKFFASTVIVMTVVAMSGAIVPNAKASAQAGDLIKKDGLSAVYFLGNDGKRYVFPSQAVYNSWYSDFSGVVTVSASDLASYPLGGNIVMRAGTKMVKITSDPTVYVVEPNGVLRAIQSESQAATLFGANWNKRIVDVADSFFMSYKVGSTLAVGATPAGSLVKNSGSAAVYYFDGTNYRQITSEAAAQANHLDLSNTITIATPIVASGTAISAADSSVDYTAQTNSTTVITSTGSALSVSKAIDTPASATTPNGVPSNFLKFNLTAGTDGDVAVSGLTLTAYGLGNATDIKDITIYGSNGNAIGNSKASMSSDKTADFNFPAPIVVAAGTTQSLLIKADIAASAANGGNYALGIAQASDVVAGNVAVTGSFPLVGNAMSNVASTNIGTVAMSTNASNSGVHSFGEDNVSLANFDLTASNENVLVQSLRLKNGGTNTTGLLSNIQLYADGSSIATGTYTSDGYVSFAINNYQIVKGSSVTFEVKADLGVGNTSDTVALYLKNITDLQMVGQSYGYALQVSTNTIPDTTHAATITMQAGDVTINMDNSATNGIANTDVKPNTTNVNLAALTLESNNETADVSAINGLTLTVAHGAGTGLIQNVKLVDATTGGAYDLNPATATNGGSFVNGSAVANGTYQYNLSDDITLTAGVVRKFYVRADIAEDNSNADVADGTTIQASLNLTTTGSIAITGNTSNADLHSQITPSSVQGSVITVRSAALAINPTSLVNTTVVGGASNVEIYRASLQSGTSDGVTLQSVKFTATGASSTMFNKNNVTQLSLYVNGQLAKTLSGTNISGNTITFGSLSNNTVAVNSTVNLSVTASFASTFTPVNGGTFGLSITGGTSDAVVRSVTGNKLITASGTISGTSENVILAANGTLAVNMVTTDSNDDSNSFLLAGSETPAGNYLGSIKFTTTNESVKVTKLYLTKVGGNTATASDLSAVKLYQIVNGVPTLVAQQVVNSDGSVTFNPFNVDFAANQSTQLYIAAVAKGINVANDNASTATPGDTIAYTVGEVDAQGDNSGQNITATVGSTASMQAVITNATLTSVTNALSDGSIGGGEHVIGKYTLVFNDGSNRKPSNDEFKALLTQFSVLVNTNNCTTTSLTLNVDGNGMTANATSFTNGVATWSKVDLASLINGISGKGAEMNGTVTLDINANVAIAGTANNYSVQTEISDLSGTGSNDSIQFGGEGTTPLTNMYIPGVNYVWGGTLHQ